MIKLLYFTAPWCGPCRSMVPVIDQLKTEGWDIEKINVDESRDLATEHRIGAVPTFIVLRDGEPVRRFTGARSKIALEQELKLSQG